MKIIEKAFQIPLDFSFSKIEANLSALLKSDETIVRFIAEHFDDKTISGSLLVLQNTENKPLKKIESIFHFHKRPYEKTDQFNVVLTIPTGIGAEVGGDSGDAQAAARLLASACDKLILHPNVMNGSDICELTPNMLYVEGSVLTRLLMGTVALAPSLKNKTLLVINKRGGEFKYFEDLSVNSASTMRVAVGADIDVIYIKHDSCAKAFFDKDGRAIGEISEFERILDPIIKESHNYDAFALATNLDGITLEMTQSYFKNESHVNPWGGVESMITHTLSSLLNKPVAHSPIPENMQNYNWASGIVVPEKSAETLSKCNLLCILKGLHKSPHLVARDVAEIDFAPGLLTAKDINCLVLPDRCLGLPILAAIEQGIQIIAVKDNQNIMHSDLDKLIKMRKGKPIIYANNYIEAAGHLIALKNGISYDTVLRPIPMTKEV